MEGTFTIQEMAERTGLTAHTLRYYERIGLIHPVDRADNGHRRYSQDDIGWIDLLKKLRATGMPIREMKTYADLVAAGNHTTGARRVLLERHRQRIERKLDEMNESLALINRKIDHYCEVEAEETALIQVIQEA